MDGSGAAGGTWRGRRSGLRAGRFVKRRCDHSKNMYQDKALGKGEREFGLMGYLLFDMLL